MFDYTYGIRSTREYFDRARSEVDRLVQLQDEALPQEAEHEVRSAATQAGTTLWHFSDFVFNAPDSDALRVRAKVGGGNLKDFQERLRASYPAIKLCWELANGGKHFRKKTRAQVEEATISATAAYFVLVGFALPWTRVLKKRRAKLVFPDGRRLRAADVFRDALAEWEALLRP